MMTDRLFQSSLFLPETQGARVNINFDSEEDTGALGEGLPSYTQDVSPPIYAVDSDGVDQIRSIRDCYNSYFERSCRTSWRDVERNIELGFIIHEQTMVRFLRRMPVSSSPPKDSARRSARDQYKSAGTDRTDSYGIDGSSIFGRSVSGTPAPGSVEETSDPSRDAQGWNHSWALPVSQAPTTYYTLEPVPIVASDAATTSPASTATPTHDLSSSSTPAQRTPDMSTLSTPGKHTVYPSHCLIINLILVIPLSHRSHSCDRTTKPVESSSPRHKPFPVTNVQNSFITDHAGNNTLKRSPYQSPP